MATFDFPYHELEVRYPESSIAVAFGGGYEFTSAPKAPDQVEYTLHFEAMFFFETVPGFTDDTKYPDLNMAVLEKFYNEHKMYKKFDYPHPTLGNLRVRFAAPLSYKIVKDGKGRVEPFSIRLKLQP
jgi:hypothetical protein